MTCSKTLGISLSLDGWGCEGKRLIRSIDDTHSPGIRKVLLDSGVSIFELFYV